MRQSSAEIKPVIRDARLVIEINIKAEADQVKTLAENTMKKA